MTASAEMSMSASLVSPELTEMRMIHSPRQPAPHPKPRPEPPRHEQDLGRVGGVEPAGRRLAPAEVVFPAAAMFAALVVRAHSLLAMLIRSAWLVGICA